jgi:putative FmdB family regulatory protein
MPIYEYQCPACGAHIEEMQKISEPPLTVCPQCGKPDLQRLVSHTGFQLKGSGYYATDYKKPAAPPESSAAPKEEKSSSAGKTDKNDK